MASNVSNFMKCKVCSKLLMSPVTLPCGSTICGIHVKTLILNKNNFQCQVCFMEHHHPDDGFSVNKIIQSLIEAKFDQINLNIGPRGEAQKECRRLKLELDELEKLIETPISISDKFDKLINKIDIKCLKEIECLQQYYGGMIDALEKEKAAAIQLARNGHNVFPIYDFNSIQKESQELEGHFNSFETDEAFWQKIRQEAEIRSQEVSVLVKMQKNLQEGATFIFENTEIVEIKGRRFFGK